MSLREVEVAAQKADDEGSLSFVVVAKGCSHSPLSNKKSNSSQDGMKCMDELETLTV